MTKLFLAAFAATAALWAQTVIPGPGAPGGSSACGTLVANALCVTNSGGTSSSYSTTLPSGLTAASPFAVSGVSGQAGFVSLAGNTSVPAAFPALSVSVFGPNAGSMSPYGIQLPASPGVTPGLAIAGATNIAVTFNGSTAVIAGANSFPIGAYLLFSAIVGPTNLTAPGYYVIATGLSSTQFEISPTYGSATGITANASGTATVTSSIVPLSFGTALPFGIGLTGNLTLTTGAVTSTLDTDGSGNLQLLAMGGNNINGLSGSQTLFSAHPISSSQSNFIIGDFMTYVGGLDLAEGSTGFGTVLLGNPAASASANFVMPAAVIPNGQFPYCVTTSLTCTLTASGVTVANIAQSNVANDFTLVQNINVGTLNAATASALQLDNTTAATSTITLQYSPDLEFEASGWNTTTPAANFARWRIFDLPTTGATVGSILEFGQSVDTGTPSYTIVGSLNNSGRWTSSALTISGTSVLFTGLTAEGATQSALCITSGGQVESNANPTCTLSNENLKHDIVPMSEVMNATDLLMAVNPIQFIENNGDDPNRVRWGFGAMQLASVDPKLADGWRADGLPYSIDQPAILALAYQTIQEQERKLETLESRITALEAR